MPSKKKTESQTIELAPVAQERLAELLPAEALDRVLDGLEPRRSPAPGG